MKCLATIILSTILSIPVLPPAQACSLPRRDSFAKALPTAKNVFVFQVISAAIAPKNSAERVVAKIRIVETLKGKPSYSHLIYFNSWCGGNRIDVGHFFIVATSQVGSHLELGPADLTVIDINEAYHENNPIATGRAGLISAVKAALAGGKLPPPFLNGEMEEYTQTFTVPPPPPPSNDKCRKKCGT
jgi:hypothetical protein